MTLNEAIAKLDELEKSTYALNHAQSILYVDGDTVAPKNSWKGRGMALAYLTELAYKQLVNPETGEMLDNPGGQGYESGSSWSRGQSWALYGFTLSYLHTGKQEYLDTAKRIAHYFISQITDDWMPRCDFRQPAEPVLKDNVAGNVAACGLLELARALPELEGKFYFDAAIRILKAQEQDAANWELNDPAIFTKCTSAWHDLPGRHITMTYGDYYFIEAVNKLRGDGLLFWYPNR